MLPFFHFLARRLRGCFQCKKPWHIRCYRCKLVLPQASTAWHTTYPSKGPGISVLCCACWSDCTPSQRLPYYYTAVRDAIARKLIVDPNYWEYVRNAVRAGL